MKKIIRNSILTSLFLFSVSVMADDIQYPMPSDTISWVNNYNPKDENDYKNYSHFMAIRYNETLNSSEKINIVREQNRIDDLAKNNFEVKFKYPTPNGLNWQNNYDPKDSQDFKRYYKFLSEKYNISNNNEEKRSIVREQNRAKSYAIRTYERNRKIFGTSVIRQN